MVDGPLVNLDKLSEPLSKLVEVVSSGIGALYEPVGIVRRAKAEAKAAVIRAESAGEVASIERRIAARLQHREELRQENLERVASIAAGELPPKVSRESVDLDWTTQFINHAQDVSDAEMQILWGRILAGEVADPGTYSKRTISFLRTLEKWEAQAFTEFCSCALRDSNGWRFLFHSEPYSEFLRSKFGSRGIESHFVTIGLLMPETGMPNPSDLNGTQVEYFGNEYRLRGPSKSDAKNGIGLLEIGPSLRNFSQIGHQLAAISGAVPIDKYVERLSVSFEKEYGVRFERVAS